MNRFSLQQLADETKARLVGAPDVVITGVAEIETATPEQATFLSNRRYHQALKTTQAGVICVDLETPLEIGKNYLLSSNPSATFEIIIHLFLTPSPSGFTGIAPSAVIHPSVVLEENVVIEPHVVIDQGCHIGKGTRIKANTTLGACVQIGEACLIHSNVVIREGSILGSRVIIQPGAVIGSCGYGYTTTADGKHLKQQQLGIVVLEDDVEIGANTTIDRARFHETRISKGTKIDNLVQIAHNVHLGPHNLIVSQTGIAGSVRTGKYVIMGGQTGTVGHISIADHALFAARSGIKKSITKGGKYGGNPAIPLDQHQREQVRLKKLIEPLT